MSQAEVTQRLEGEIIPPELAVRAMRDSGYRNTAYALAELIDNSVQAGARNVDVICVQGPVMVDQRERRRMTAIEVIDNGHGMTPDVLRLALQFGNGTHLNDRKGIGRFGMGLPNSSISQCRRVELWSWQNGPDNALYTFLDVDDIESRSLIVVPPPVAIVDWVEGARPIGNLRRKRYRRMPPHGPYCSLTFGNNEFSDVCSQAMARRDRAQDPSSLGAPNQRTLDF